MSILTDLAPQTFWYISRASAFVAFGLLWLSMLAGLGITSRLSRVWPSLPGAYELHRFTEVLTGFLKSCFCYEICALSTRQGCFEVSPCPFKIALFFMDAAPIDIG